MDGYGSKIRKVSIYRPALSNETILATRQEFFITKLAPVQSITGIILLNFWLMLLSWMFTSSYTIYIYIYFFFLKEIYFFEWLNFSEYDIWMSFWLRKGPSIKYVRKWWGMGRHPKCVQLRTRAGSVTSHVYVCTHTISFLVFDSSFLL